MRKFASPSTSSDPPPPRKRFFPFINQKYCILEPLRKGKMMIGLAHDTFTMLSKDWLEVEEDDHAHVILVAKVDEEQVFAKYVGDGGMWINHRPIKKNIIYALHEGDVVQLKADGPLYTVCFVIPREMVMTSDEPFAPQQPPERSVSEGFGREGFGKTARFV